jgi:hypothetical protein
MKAATQAQAPADGASRFQYKQPAVISTSMIADVNAQLMPLPIGRWTFVNAAAFIFDSPRA